MKRNYAILILSALVLLSAGCKKKSFDPMSKGQNDFIGTWKGTLTTFKNNKLMKETGSILIFPEEGGTLLGGVIFMNETRSFRQFQFLNGTLYFKIFNTDPQNPVCQNWNLGGYASFVDETTIDVRISGNECGIAGSEYVDWGGTMGISSEPKDSLACFTFAKTGNDWTYKVYLESGDSCQIVKNISQKNGDYSFNGQSTNTCGFPSSSMPFQWIVTPAEFSILSDPTLDSLPILIPVYAQQNVTYLSVVNADTVTLTLLYKNDVVNTTAGSFSCNQYRITQPRYTNGIKSTFTSYLWVHYHYGIIKQLVLDPIHDEDIKVQTLGAKNFQ